jgi:hypothetical protein
MVPVAGHFEQFSNARDAARAGAGIYDSVFNLDNLIDYLPKHQYNSDYKEWADSSEALILKHLQETVG